MIRRQQEKDLARLAELWLDTNLRAHDFIPAEYWKANFESVKAMLPQAEVYVYEEEGEIQGFIGLSGDYVAGIFVSSAAQSRGIGKRLMDHAKGLRARLVLHVYRKNTRAVRFYRREEFHIQCERGDEAAAEAEYELEWRADRGGKPGTAAEQLE